MCGTPSRKGEDLIGEVLSLIQKVLTQTILKLTIQNFISQISAIFGYSIFRLVASVRMINYLSREC